MKRFKKWLISLCAWIIESCVEASEHHEVRVGDVFWCRMPLSEEELIHVEPGHRIRPYVITEVNDSTVKGYACYSKLSAYCSVNQQYMIDKNNYDELRKSSYVNLSRECVLPLTSVEKYYYTLNKEDFRNLRSHSNREIENSRKSEIGIGSVVRKDDRYYYVYNYRKPYFYTYPLLLEAELVNWSILQTISCNQKVYYIDYATKMQLHQDEVKKKCMQLSKKDIQLIEGGKNGFVTKTKHKRVDVVTRKPFNFNYPNGQLFYEKFQERCFLYLYSQKGKDYGCYLDDNEDGRYRIRKANLEYMDKDGLLQAEELLEVIKLICVSDSNVYPLEKIKKKADKALKSISNE